MASPPDIPDIDVTELVDGAMRLTKAGLSVGIPARVESYDPNTGRVRAQPLIRVARYGEDGERIVERAPVVPAARVKWPSGGGASLVFDLKAGDVVELHFQDRSIGAWAVSDAESDPEHGEYHDMVDAVADPALRAENRPWPQAPSGGLTIGVDNGLRIEISPNAVNLGTGSTQPVALGNSVESRLKALESFASTHSHTVALGVATATGVTLAAPNVRSSVINVRE